MSAEYWCTEHEESREVPCCTACIATPKWADLYGILPDFTGGMSVDEWLEEQRGEA